MATLYDRLKNLKRLRRDTRVEALVRTIPHASSEESDAIVAELIDIAGSCSRAEVIIPVFRQWEHLTTAARSALIAAVGDALSDVLAHVRASDEPGDKSALASLLIEYGQGSDGSSPSSFQDPEIFEALDASLAHAAETLPGEAPPGLLDRILDAAHAPGPRLRAWLSAEEHPGHMRLRAACRKRPQRWLDEHAVALLGLPALSAVASSHIGESDRVESRTDWLRRWHLLLARDRHRALARHMDDRHAFEIALTPADDPDARLGGIIWLTSVCRNRKRVTASLASCLTDPSARVRLTAARSLRRRRDGSQTDDVLMDFAFDADSRVAETAAIGLAEARSYSRDRHLRDTYRALTRSPHPRVRRASADALLRVCPDSALRNTDPLACPIASRRMLARDRAGFVEWIRGVTRSHETEDRLRAFELASRLRVLDEIEADIVRAVRDEDERIASKAALLVGLLKGPGPEAALRYSLEHASDRVRANALESFAREAESNDELRPYLGDAASRVRANAIRHLLRAQRGSLSPESALIDMLADPRPGHRLSAVWAAQSAGAVDLAGRIDDMSKTDPDPAVVTRARSCSTYFNRLFRAGWSAKNAPTVTVRTQTRRHVG